MKPSKIVIVQIIKRKGEIIGTTTTQMPQLRFLNPHQLDLLGYIAFEALLAFVQFVWSELL